MPSDQQISLNFLPLVQQDFSFTVYRTPYIEQPRDLHPSWHRHQLPKDAPPDTVTEREDCWVSLAPEPSFSPFTCSARTNRDLSCRFLFHLLRNSAQTSLSTDKCLIEEGYRRRIVFVLQALPQGDQCVWLSPHFLWSQEKFGFLTDFWFRRDLDKPFNREVLRLSLSLDSHYRENRNFYADRFQQIQHFVRNVSPALFPLRTEAGKALEIHTKLIRLPPARLKNKSYVFQGNATGSSQFVGVRQYGPLTPIANPTRLCFVYRPEDKPFSYDLFRALRGDTYPSFPGMQSMFRYNLSQEHVTGVPVSGFTEADLEGAVRQIKAIPSGTLVVPVVLVPWNRLEGPDVYDDYYRAKHVFLRNSLPSQFVSLKTIQDKRVFKWSVSNIGLAIFAKLGGQPWKVRPQNDNCLIVGVGQSHKLNQDRQITRYYAYCVLADSSGLYEDLRVLSRDSDETGYLGSLGNNLAQVFSEHAGRFRRFAIHTTFAIRRHEIDAIYRAIEQFKSQTSSTHEFTVVKFNDDSRFFGWLEASNSMVPYESTYVRLSREDYLIWFEGLQYHKPDVTGRVAKPLQATFLYPHDPRLTDEQQEGYLQDALNLSGANWRGFNAKTLPVSVYYAQLIARYFKEFDRLGLAELDLHTLTPWFL